MNTQTRRLIIIVEGQTEEEFVKRILAPWLLHFGIHSVSPIKIATSKIQKGGFVNYAHLKNDTRKYLKNEADIFVTTFVDFFRVPVSVPGYLACQQKNQQVDAKIDCLQAAIDADINDPRFQAYIQKHEFEALMFAGAAAFELQSEAIQNAVAAVPYAFVLPEEINSTPTGAPSKRLESIFENAREKYEKGADAIDMAELTGMEKILEKCPRFQQWVSRLIAAATQ